MMEVLLALLVLLAYGFAGFVYLNSQKQTERIQKEFTQQMREIAQMLMAGSFQEYSRIKAGKKPVANKVEAGPNDATISEDNPIPFDEITGVKINNEPKRKVKIYR